MRITLESVVNRYASKLHPIVANQIRNSDSLSFREVHFDENISPEVQIGLMVVEKLKEYARENYSLLNPERILNKIRSSISKGNTFIFNGHELTADQVEAFIEQAFVKRYPIEFMKTQKEEQRLLNQAARQQLGLN